MAQVSHILDFFLLKFSKLNEQMSLPFLYALGTISRSCLYIFMVVPLELLSRHRSGSRFVMYDLNIDTHHKPPYGSLRNTHTHNTSTPTWHLVCANFPIPVSTSPM